jgi:hypothetical protein
VIDAEFKDLNDLTPRRDMAEVLESTRESLKELRLGMLRLHKLLLDEERVKYERARGPVGNSYEFLQLVMNDPWFDWLHRLSELIVQIDELLAIRDVESPASEEDAQALVGRTKELLAPSESGGEFQKNYFLALQKSPDVVLQHKDLRALMANFK